MICNNCGKEIYGTDYWEDGEKILCENCYESIDQHSYDYDYDGDEEDESYDDDDMFKIKKY